MRGCRTEGVDSEKLSGCLLAGSAKICVVLVCCSKSIVQRAGRWAIVTVTEPNVGCGVEEGVYEVVEGAQDFTQSPGSCVGEDGSGTICVSRTRMVCDWYEGGGDGVEGKLFVGKRRNIP